MSNVQVTYQEMRSAGDKLTNGQQEINTQLDALKREIDNLLSAGYVTSNSSGKFQASYTEFNAGVRNVLEGLQGMSQYLHTAAQTFEDADTTLASRLA
jgi:WXG100 family type VII secretion target